jgi:hypothetical protein
MDRKISTGKNVEGFQMNSTFVAYRNMFMEPSDYDEIALYKILYFVIGMGLLAE